MNLGSRGDKMKDFSVNQLRSLIYELEDERDKILSKMTLLSKEEEEELDLIEFKIQNYTSLIDKDGAK